MPLLARGVALLPLLFVAASEGGEGPPAAPRVAQGPGSAPVPRPILPCAADRRVIRAWSLPPRLEEFSGLTRTAGGRILAHQDNQGRIFELDPTRGSVVKEFRLRGLPRDDFEGIAATPGGLVLMTSRGRLYRFAEGAAGGDVPYTTFDTGLGRLCELEGLAYDPSQDVLLLPCKTPRDPRLLGSVTIFRWSLATMAPADPRAVVVPAAAVRRVLRTVAVRPTAVEWDGGTGHLLLLASSPAVVLELDRTGAIVGVAQLDQRRHRKPEALTLQPGELLIGDEGRGGRARLTAYPCAH